MENEDKVETRILAIDCAVGNGSVAVLGGGKVLASSRAADGSPARAEEILQVIKAVMSKAETSIEDLGSIAVSVGPGSYSGIRIGLATAAGLTGALSIPCIGVSALDAISLSAAMEGEFFAAVGVGKRHIGSASFQLTAGGATSLSDYTMNTDDQFGIALGSYGEVVILCDPSLTSRLRSLAPADAVVSEIQNTVAELIGLFAHRHPDVTSRRPIYLRDQAGSSGQPVILP